MAYSINPNLPRARALAMQLLIRDRLPLAVVANRSGVHRSTIWRWRRKWQELNQHLEFGNPNRPGRPVSRSHKLAMCIWRIPTLPAVPLSSPKAISSQIVALVCKARDALKRCAEVVWNHIVTNLGIAISLSSVRRILKRHHYFDGARKKRVRPGNPRRPRPASPGELVETDTIHHVDPFSGRRMYIYTVIDIYSRMTYARAYSRILPGLAARTVLDASRYFGFSFCLVQADNGPEFGSYFRQQLARQGVQVRHTRLGRPNDNAHIERFNRTIQDECTGYYWRRRITLASSQAKLDNYLDYYNTKRVHLGLQLKTPSEMLQRS